MKQAKFTSDDAGNIRITTEHTQAHERGPEERQGDLEQWARDEHNMPLWGAQRKEEGKK